MRKTCFELQAFQARMPGFAVLVRQHLLKQDELIRIGHGVYRGASVPVADDFRWEDLIETMQRVKEGVICLTSALSLYHLTEEMPS